MRGSFAEVCRSLGNVCGGLGDVVYCEVYINFKNIRFKNSENRRKKYYLCEINEKQYAPKSGLNEKRYF